MITKRMIEYENAGNLHTKQISGIIREICTTPEMQACITSIQHLLEMDLYEDLQDQHLLYSNEPLKIRRNKKVNWDVCLPIAINAMLG